jgi:hypothetical protein
MVIFLIFANYIDSHHVVIVITHALSSLCSGVTVVILSSVTALLPLSSSNGVVQEAYFLETDGKYAE